MKRLGIIPALASPAVIGLSYVFYLYRTGVLTGVNWTYGVLAILVAILCSAFYRRCSKTAMGGLLIFLIYGMMIALGLVYVMTGRLIWSTLWVVAPAGLLVVAMLLARNTRDMQQDEAVGRRTQAISLGLEGAQVTYQTMLLAAYLLVAVAVMLHLLSALSFGVLLSFPLALLNISRMKRATPEDAGSIRSLDVQTALLVLLFSVLLAAANFISPFI